jgi:hypothetical protein
MSRQDYAGDIQWIIVNDCGDYATTSELLSCDRLVLQAVEPWRGRNTQHANLLMALKVVEYPNVIIVEDDDWYAPSYIRHMVELLEDAPLVGQIPTLCYNVRFRAWLNYGNFHHASLCQTAFRGEVIPTLEDICHAGQFVDLALFARTNHKLAEGQDVVSIKGMPGRPGVMIQHRRFDPRFQRDPNLEKLRELIGDDAEHYKVYGSDSVQERG